MEKTTARQILDFFKNMPPIIWVAGIMLSFWLASALMDFFLLHEIVSAMYIGVAAAVLLVFGRTALIAMITVGGLDRGQQVALGIVLSWFGNELHRLYHLRWRALGEPLDMINHDWVTAFLMITVIGGVMHITVPSPDTGYIPRVSWVILAAALALGTAVAGFIVGANWGPPSIGA